MERGGCGGERLLLFLGGGGPILLARDGGAQTQLELRFGGAEERLVDLRLVGVEGDIGAGAVRVALEDDVLARGDLQEVSELYT